MRRDLSCMVAVCAFLLFILLVVQPAWCSKPWPQPDSRAVAETLVRRALESEVAGDAQRRGDLLKQALEAAPDYPSANWHLGRVKVDGRWVTLQEAARIAVADQRLAQYRRLRDEALGDAKRELRLARWCARMGLADESKLHFTRLLNMNRVDQKARAEAMRALGLREVGGRLVSDQELKQQRQVATLIQQSMNRWRPKLRAWQPAIDGSDGKKREYAIRLVEKIDDPNVIPVLETLLFEGGPRFGQVVVGLLGKFPQYEATQTLVRYAVLSQWPNVRSAAVRELGRRPMHEYVPLLLQGLVSPITTQWQIVDAPDGTIRYQHRFFRGGAEGNVAVGIEHVASPVPTVVDRRLTRPLDAIDEGPDRRYRYTWFPLRGMEHLEELNELERELEAAARLAEAWQREKTVALANARANVRNAPVFVALEQTTGRFPKREPAAWFDWWQQYNEVQTSPTRPTCYLYRQSQSYLGDYYRAYHEPVDVYQYRGSPSRYRWPWLSCFPAGTEIWTRRGRVPIERIKIGDRVLSQDPDTGELAFKLVLSTTLRPPSPMIKATVDGEDLLTTLGHPVWVSEKRWRMAKLLEVGDQLHGLSGILTVDGIDDQVPVSEAHNLVVADWATYFVGRKGVLVHDNTYRAPTRALVPGLLPEHDYWAGDWLTSPKRKPGMLGIAGRIRSVGEEQDP